jgi:uncharacterized protein
MTRRGVGALVTAATIACVPSYRGPIIDAHAHLRTTDNDGVSESQPLGTAALRLLDQAAAVNKSALIVIARGGPEATRAGNDAVIKAAAADPQHFYAVASVDPGDGDSALAELDRLSGLGVKIIKLHPNTQAFDVADPAVARIAERCGQRQLTVLFDSYNPFDPGQIGKFIKLALAQPDTRFVLAHMAFSQFRELSVFAMLRKLGRIANVWFDISAVAVMYARSPVAAELVWTMRAVGIDRVVFGSDWPVDTPAVAVAAVRSLGLDANESKRVFHDNIAELLQAR